MKLSAYKKFIGAFIILTVIYLLQTTMTPADKAALAKYHISSGQAFALTLTIALPYIIIWFIALAGYLWLRSYTDTIRDSKDGAALATIAKGIFWLTLWLPLSAIAGGLTTYARHSHSSLIPTSVILNNYFNLILLAPVFVMVYRGSLKLLPLIKIRHPTPYQPINVLFIVFSALYVLLVLHDPARRLPTHSTTVASYYEPDWLIITTIVIPRLIMWFFGFQAVYYIYLYSKKVRGTLYKAALKNLSKGLAWVVVSIVVLRCLQSLTSPFSQLNLALVLVAIYGLLVLIATGYVFIARGARNLQRIEEL